MHSELYSQQTCRQCGRRLTHDEVFFSDHAGHCRRCGEQAEARNKHAEAHDDQFRSTPHSLEESS